MEYQVSQLQQQHNDLSNDAEQQPTITTLMNTNLLAYIMDKLAKSMDIQHIDPHSVMYMAVATQHRLTTFLQHTIDASQHRIQSQHADAQLKVTHVQDIRKQLLAMERVDRETERRRRQAIVDREHQAHQDHDDTMEDDDHADDDGHQAPKKKKKKKKEMGPGAAARNMSDDVYKQATNKTALMSAGGIRKSWMMLASGSSPSSSSSKPSLPPPPPPLSAPPPTTSQESSSTGRGRPKSGKKLGEAGSKRSRKRDASSSSMVLPPSMIGRQPSGRGGEAPPRKVTLVDAMYALEQELDTGYECGQRALIRSYNQYLK